MDSVSELQLGLEGHRDGGKGRARNLPGTRRDGDTQRQGHLAYRTSWLEQRD